MIHKQGLTPIKHRDERKKREVKMSTTHILVFPTPTWEQVNGPPESSWTRMKQAADYSLQLQGRGNILWRKPELTGGLIQLCVCVCVCVCAHVRVCAWLNMSNSVGLWSQILVPVFLLEYISTSLWHLAAVCIAGGAVRLYTVMMPLWSRITRLCLCLPWALNMQKVCVRVYKSA